MSSSEEVAEFGATVSSACTSCGTLGHGHAGIEALSRLREDSFFAEQDKRLCAKLREEMKKAACDCQPPAADSNNNS